MLHGHQHGVVALHVEERFLLPGKGGVRHVFCCGRGTHGERGLTIISRKLVIGFTNSVFQLTLERSIDDPLADLCPGFRQFRDVVNVGFIQQFINALVDAALIKKLIKRISGCGKPVGYGNTHRGQVCNHFSQGGIFASDSVYIIHAELVVPKHQR